MDNFKVKVKGHRLNGEVGRLIERVSGFPSLYKLQFPSGEIRAFMACELSLVEKELKNKEN